MFVFIYKELPEYFAFLILGILELFAREIKSLNFWKK